MFDQATQFLLSSPGLGYPSSLSLSIWFLLACKTCLLYGVSIPECRGPWCLSPWCFNISLHWFLVALCTVILTLSSWGPHWVCFVFPWSHSAWMYRAQGNADRFTGRTMVRVIEKVEIWESNLVLLPWTIPPQLWLSVLICKMKQLNWIISKIHFRSKIPGLVLD